MPLTGAQRQKRYRERLKIENPTKYEEKRKTHLEKVKERQNKIKDLSETEKNIQRKKWREANERKKDKKDQSQVSTNGNEIKVFCPKCNTEVSHTAEGIQQDQTKILIAKVYRYFEQEYEELKRIYGHLDLTPLSKFCQRTTLATGVSEAMVMQILKEEERRNEERQREPPQKKQAARKRRRQTTHSSSEEDSSDDNVEEIEQPSPSEETLVVKTEPPEYNIVEPELFVPAAMKLEPSDSDDASNEEPEIFIPAVKVEPSDDDTNKEYTDPIALEMKFETHDDEENTTDATPAPETSATKRKAKKTPRLGDETHGGGGVGGVHTDATPAPETSATKRKAKKTQRLGDETSVQQQTQAECSTSAASRRKRRETGESCLPGGLQIKIEEGFS